MLSWPAMKFFTTQFLRIRWPSCVSCQPSSVASCARDSSREYLGTPPSQGTHFFQNLTSFNVGYFTVNPDAGDSFVDWDYLAAQPPVRESAFVRHLRFPRPVMVKMNGKANQGVIIKPDAG